MITSSMTSPLLTNLKVTVNTGLCLIVIAQPNILIGKFVFYFAHESTPSEDQVEIFFFPCSSKACFLTAFGPRLGIMLTFKESCLVPSNRRSDVLDMHQIILL